MLIAKRGDKIQRVVAREQPVEGDLTTHGAGLDAGVGPGPDGVASRRVDACARSWISLPLTLEMALHLLRRCRDRRIIVLSQRPDERRQSARVGTLGLVEAGNPLHNVGHSVTSACLRRPTAFRQSTVAPDRAKTDRSNSSRSQPVRVAEPQQCSLQSGRGMKRAPGRRWSAAYTKRIEHFDLTDCRSARDRPVKDVRLDRRHDRWANPFLDTTDETCRLARLARAEHRDRAPHTTLTAGHPSQLQSSTTDADPKRPGRSGSVRLPKRAAGQGPLSWRVVVAPRRRAACGGRVIRDGDSQRTSETRRLRPRQPKRAPVPLRSSRGMGRADGMRTGPPMPGADRRS